MSADIGVFQSCTSRPSQSPFFRCNLEAAKLTEPSDAKISVNCGHVYGSESLEDIQVLDLILVQVGRKERPNLECEDESEDAHLKFVSLPIKTSRRLCRWLSLDFLEAGRQRHTKPFICAAVGLDASNLIPSQALVETLALEDLCYRLVETRIPGVVWKSIPNFPRRSSMLDSPRALPSQGLSRSAKAACVHLAIAEARISP